MGSHRHTEKSKGEGKGMGSREGEREGECVTRIEFEILAVHLLQLKRDEIPLLDRQLDKHVREVACVFSSIERNQSLTTIKGSD